MLLLFFTILYRVFITRLTGWLFIEDEMPSRAAGDCVLVGGSLLSRCLERCTSARGELLFTVTGDFTRGALFLRRTYRLFTVRGRRGEAFFSTGDLEVLRLLTILVRLFTL